MYTNINFNVQNSKLCVISIVINKLLTTPATVAAT